MLRVFVVRSAVAAHTLRSFPFGTNFGRVQRIKKPHLELFPSGVIKIGDTYFRECFHYHRLGVLNYCVRNGNRCLHYNMVAKKGRSRVSHYGLEFGE